MNTTVDLAAQKALAIVIPAHRITYLEQTLASLAAQTDRRFTVYVGDDASPDDLGALCYAYSEKLQLHYQRFQTNLGRHDLVGQWSRCVRWCVEPWVWLLGDDDLLEPGCVAAFHAAFQVHPDIELFHFNVRRIDAQGHVLCDEPSFPPILSSREFVRGRCLDRLSSYAPEYVFRRATFDTMGGFETFPLAWCTDDATWAKLAMSRGIHTISGPRVRWRLSGANLSSPNPATRASKVEAALRYVEWLSYRCAAWPKGPADPSDEELRDLACHWFFMHVLYLRSGLGAIDAWRTSRRLVRAGVVRALPLALVRCARLNWRLRASM